MFTNIWILALTDKYSNKNVLFNLTNDEAGFQMFTN